MSIDQVGRRTQAQREIEQHKKRDWGVVQRLWILISKSGRERSCQKGVFGFGSDGIVDRPATKVEQEWGVLCKEGSPATMGCGASSAGNAIGFARTDDRSKSSGIVSATMSLLPAGMSNRKGITSSATVTG